MSPESPHRPSSELGRQLLASARDEAPPEASTQRALDFLDQADASASAADGATDEGTPASSRGTRWILWALPAAAILVGVAWASVLRQPGEGETSVAEPAVTLSPDLTAAATAAATATEIEVALPAASARPSASASAKPAPSAVAHRDPARPPTGKRPPTASKPPPKSGGAKGACGCKSDDLMCMMRCSKKKK